MKEGYSLNVAIFHCPLVIKWIYYGKTLVLVIENIAFPKTMVFPLMH